VCVYIYIYIYTYVCVCMCFNIKSLANINWIFKILCIHVARKPCTVFLIAFVYIFYVHFVLDFYASLKKTLREPKNV